MTPAAPLHKWLAAGALCMLLGTAGCASVLGLDDYEIGEPCEPGTELCECLPDLSCGPGLRCAAAGQQGALCVDDPNAPAGGVAGQGGQ